MDRKLKGQASRSRIYSGIAATRTASSARGLEDKTAVWGDRVHHPVAGIRSHLRGEPTLSRDLEKWVRRARDQGKADIILCTNGVRLSDADYVKRLCESGITLFNVNLPAHEERLFDLLTRTRGQFHARLAALGTLISIAGGKKVRLNLVVNSLNSLVIPLYARFVKETFPEIFYIEFNLIKVLGYVHRRPYLVPRLRDVAPRLSQAMDYMTRVNMKFIADGFPLCVMDGYEYAAIDAVKRYCGDGLYMEEKAKTSRCAECSLAAICAGPRVDYVQLYGDEELTPSRKDPRPIIAKVAALGEKRWRGSAQAP